MHLFGLLEETMDGHPGQDTETVRRKSWQNQDKATDLTCPVPGLGTGNGFPAELPVRFVLTTTIPGMSYLKFFGGLVCYWAISQGVTASYQNLARGKRGENKETKWVPPVGCCPVPSQAGDSWGVESLEPTLCRHTWGNSTCPQGLGVTCRHHSLRNRCQCLPHPMFIFL